MSEILEEHLKDILWLFISVIVGIVLFNSVKAMKVELLNNISKSIILVIEKYADLSARYGCCLTVSLPDIPLIDYLILLKGNKYYITIQGICVYEGEVDRYLFNEASLKPGVEYLIKTLEKEVIFIIK